MWVEQDASDRPLNFGLMGDEILIDDPVDERLEVTLPTPDDIDEVEPYKHFRVYYLPDGHSPSGLDISQFKFRAYLVDEDERETLTEADEDERQVEPSAQYLPSGFELLERDDHPPVGSQWVSNEINSNEEGDINYIYAYGFNDGELVYIETTVSLQALEQNPEAQLEIEEPNAFQKEGFYPQFNFISYTNDSDEFFISKDQLFFSPAD